MMKQSLTPLSATGCILLSVACAVVAEVGLFTQMSFAADPPQLGQTGTVQASVWDPPLPEWSVRQVDENGSIHVPGFVLTESSLLSEHTRAALRIARDRTKREDAAYAKCPDERKADRATMPAIRQCEAMVFYQLVSYQALRERYPVLITGQTIGGVYTEVFTPKTGIAPENRSRVLVNLHGGHFEGGSRTISHLESIPIAAVGKIKVISIDYRMAPEYTFPAATEDVADVYRELLKSYRPQDIGIYGSSAGGLLTAESIAWFERHALPLPGAVGMFAGAATYYQEGVSAQIEVAVEGFPFEPSSVHPYFKRTAVSDPLAFPGKSPELMARFPPSLLISSTRDLALSSVVYTHEQLLQLGVGAQLRIWDGLTHQFYNDPTLPESREVYEVITRFFQCHLGHNADSSSSYKDRVDFRCVKPR